MKKQREWDVKNEVRTHRLPRAVKNFQQPNIGQGGLRFIVNLEARMRYCECMFMSSEIENETFAKKWKHE